MWLQAYKLMRKYIPFLVLACFVAIGLSAKLQVDLQGGFAKSDRRQDTGPAPIRPECVAWSSMWGPNPCDGDNANLDKVNWTVG